MSGSPAAARRVGNQSSCGDDAVVNRARCDLAGPADHRRHAEAAFPGRVLLVAERRHAAVRPGVHVRAVVGGEHDDGVVVDAQVVELLEHLRRRCSSSSTMPSWYGPANSATGRMLSGTSSVRDGSACGSGSARGRTACSALACCSMNRRRGRGFHHRWSPSAS